MKRALPLHVHLSTLFLVISLSIGGAIAVVGYRMSYDMLESSASELTLRISRELLGRIEGILKPANLLTRVLSYNDLCAASDFDSRWRQLGLLRESLDSASSFSSLYVGYQNGDFFLLRRLRSPAEREAFHAPEGTDYIVQSLEHQRKSVRGRYFYLNAQMQLLRVDERPDYATSYDPRARAWYQQAMAAEREITTAPYVFFADRKVGLTVARRAANLKAVVGADIRLETLSDTLRQQSITEFSQAVLVNPAGQVIADQRAQPTAADPKDPSARPRLLSLSELETPALKALGPLLQSHVQSGELEAHMHQLEWGAESWRVLIQPLLREGADPLYLLVAIPSRELFASALKLRSTAINITLLIVLLSIPLIWVVARIISRSLRRLANEAEAIRQFEFSKPIQMRSMIREVGELATTMDITKATIRRFLDITQAVAAEDNFDRLLPLLLHETMSACSAERGVLYLLSAGDGLHPSAALWANGDSALTGLQPFSLAGNSGLLRDALDQRLAQSGSLGADELAETGLEADSERFAGPYALAVPLLNRRRQLLGLMLLQRQTPITRAEQSFITALSGTAVSSLETRELIRDQKDLFESFIQMIAGAIDAKSPYTGGHCARVPELTKQMAKAACAADAGPFRDFQLSEDEWEALHIASWLHDCGKVTTPEYVVDKATKLETLYNRIHEIRTRFEVLKRDAEIQYLRARLDGLSEVDARARLELTWQQLDEDFAFVAQCNEGGEFMTVAQQERLAQIARQTWMRTLDDRLGLSREERERKTAAEALPVREFLLADKPEHCIRRRPQDQLAADNPWGLRMPVPNLLYNRGELHNLSVGRGTLCEEERYKVNEHIVQTIIMLSQLPFPRYLRQVPEIAGGHHEKMDGTGYPRGLKKDEMSPLARMMAIADIFEALTAVDRPYKRGKTLSEAIRIMAFMVRDQHIDPDIFRLFLESGVYLEYAQRFMQPEQVDPVDVAAFLALAASVR